MKDKYHFLVMDHLGPSLQSMLDDGWRFNVKVAALIAEQVVSRSYRLSCVLVGLMDI
jgi:hypothetical protein